MLLAWFLQSAIAVFNPSPAARTEWVLYGAPSKGPNTCLSLAGSYLNCARVAVSGNRDGEVQTIPDEDPTITMLEFHEAVRTEIMAQGFVPWADVNGFRADLEPKSLAFADKHVVATVWTARTPDGLVELVTYLFHRQAHVKFEVAFFCESLTTPSKPITLDIGFRTGDRVVPYIYDFGAIPPHGLARLLAAKPLGDTQGAAWTGVLLFYTPTMLANPNHPDTQTSMAQIAGPLFAVQRWPAWGLWGKAPPTVMPATINAEAASESGMAWANPFSWCGYILAETPGQTGEQAEFGAWHHVSTVGGYTAKLLWYQQRAAMREVCRPVHYVEADGSWVQARNHPRWVTWSNETHWNSGVSPDRLGRTHSGSVTIGGWRGWDDQHEGGLFANEQWRLTGSVGIERWILRPWVQTRLSGWTLPSTNPGWATNDAGPGRAVGRTWLRTSQTIASFPAGDPDSAALIDRGAKRWTECIDRQWRNWCNGPADALHPYTWIVNDPRTTFPTQTVWAPWQDAIGAMGSDAFAMVLARAGRPEASGVQAFALKLATDVVRFGYEPSGAQAVSYCPVPNCAPPSNYNDPLLCLLANGTDFARWNLMAVGVLQRATSDSALLDRCLVERRLNESIARDTYTGTLP